jgi:hypothetical protein
MISSSDESRVSKIRKRLSARVFINTGLGAVCGAIWYAVFMAVSATRSYLSLHAEGNFYLDVFAFHYFNSILETFWVLPLIGALAGVTWPVTSRDEQTESVVFPGTRQLVILVHGTFAAKKEDYGGAWWQTDGSVAATLEQAAPGTFEVVPFHWSGKNLESARRGGAKRLSKLIAKLEKDHRGYHLIAHSHGGNVVWRALLHRAAMRQKLDGLLSWTTVGTPFLFFRTSAPPLCVLPPLAVAYWLFTQKRDGLVAMLSKTNGMWQTWVSFQDSLIAPIVFEIVAGMALLLAAVLTVGFIWTLAGLFLNYRLGTNEKLVYENYRSRHLLIASDHDEAIRGLSAATRLVVEDALLVPKVPYCNTSFFGKLISPLTFPGIALWNSVIGYPVNEWVVNLLRDRMHGNDIPQCTVQGVLYSPQSDSPTLEPVEEQDLERLSREASGATVGRIRDAVGVFASGSPVALVRGKLTEASLGGLIHTSYFSNDHIVNRICHWVMNQPTESAEDASMPKRHLSHRSLFSTTVAAKAVLLTACFVGLCAIAATIFLTAILPNTTSGKLEALVSETSKIARFARGDEARVWYATLCFTGRCEQTVAGYHFEVHTADNLKTLIELARWQAACGAQSCKSRDWFLDTIKKDWSQYGDPSETIWLVAEGLGGLQTVPFSLGPPSLASLVMPISSKDSIESVRAAMRNVLAAHAAAPDAESRASILYATPLFQLSASEDEMHSWDKNVPPFERLENKVRLAESCACTPTEERLLVSDDGLAVDRIRRYMRPSEDWWGGCDKHRTIAQLALRLGMRDYAELGTIGPRRTMLVARYLIALRRSWSDAPVEANEISKEFENRLQGDLEDGLRVAAATQEWPTIISVLRLVSRGENLRLTNPTIAELDRALLQQTETISPDWVRLMRAYTAIDNLPKLKRAILNQLVSRKDAPPDWDEALTEFSSLLKHNELAEACREGQSGLSTLCGNLQALEPAWSARSAVGPVASELLKAARLREGVANDVADAGPELTHLFQIEAQLRATLDWSGQRLGTSMQSAIYLQAARAMAAAGNFQQAMRYAANISLYEDRLLAASEIVLRYEALRNALHTDDLDFVIDWGNRNWSAATKRWIRNNPNH